MRKILSILALALAASNAFAEKGHHKSKDKWTKQECARYEFNEDGIGLKDGKEIQNMEIISAGLMCEERIKGADKVRKSRSGDSADARRGKSRR